MDGDFFIIFWHLGTELTIGYFLTLSPKSYEMPNFKIHYEINMIYKNRAKIIFEQPKNPLNGSIKAHMDISNGLPEIN